MNIVLYYAPNTCALAPYVTLTEANAPFETRHAQNGTCYEDPGPDNFQRRSKHTQSLLRRLRDLGYSVKIKPLPEAA